MTMEAMPGAPEQQWLRDVAISLRMWVSSVRSTHNFHFAQAVRDRHKEALARYPNLRQVRWVQEEPANMGAYSFVEPRLRATFPKLSFRQATRVESASPATTARIVANATAVFPLPTSPCSRRFIGRPLARSARISATARSCAAVSANGNRSRK